MRQNTLLAWLCAAVAPAAAAFIPEPRQAGPPPIGPTQKITNVLVGHPVREKSLLFYPEKVTAAPGEVIRFQFRPHNHTVTQASGPDAPCSPIKSGTPINSGFIPGVVGDEAVPVFDMPVTSSDPLYLYCGQPPHCNLGMVMIVNPKSDADVDKYKDAAKADKSTIPADAVSGGTLSTIPSTEAIKPPT